ncbi:MAG: peptidoglycan-binding domain-containing protein, partial [Clostridia bacterium]|nr:peptidoglycan-binding domain-containing protein [Clostridia bacterium]
KGTEKRTCSLCKKSETRDIAATGHKWSSWKETKPATCTETAVEERKCSNCGKTQKRAGAPATGHTWGQWQDTREASCEHSGMKQRTCSVCKQNETQYTPILDHDWSDWVIITEPTAEADGEKQRTCSMCGVNETEAVYLEDGILKEGDTGDEVIVLQKMMKDIDLEPGQDGVFDAETTASLRALQSEHGMPVSGVATRPT